MSRKVSLDLIRGPREKHGEDTRELVSLKFRPGSLAFVLTDFDEEGTQLGKQSRAALNHFPEQEIDHIFKQLSVYCVQLCQLPESDVEVIQCFSVAFTGTADRKKVSFGFAKELDEGWNWVVNSPLVSAIPVDETGSLRAVPDNVAGLLEDLRILAVLTVEEFAATVKKPFAVQPTIEVDAKTVFSGGEE